MNDVVLRSALTYLKDGLRVLPLHHPVIHSEDLACSCGNPHCSSPAKHPVARLTPRGLLDATEDPSVVQEWFADSRWNIGIVTGAVSGIVALDVDPRHDGIESLTALEGEHGPLPPTWRFLTGGGGLHILFRHPGGKIPNSAGKLGPGIDGRGDGGYIVAPPSLHMSGRLYETSADHHPDAVPLADMPDWLLRLTRADPRRPAGRRVEEWRGVVAATVPEGRRNHTIAELSGHLLAKGVDPHVCLDLMVSFNTTHCRPSLSEREVAKTVANIACRELGQRAAGRGRMSSHG